MRFSVRGILHRVDPVHDKVENDLLELNAVGEDRQRILCEQTGQFELLSNGKRRKECKRFANNVIQVDVFQFKGCFFQQAAHPPDDLTGAPVIPHNIVHDILEFNDIGECSDVGVLSFQDRGCGFGVRQNGAERLVDFMRNGGRQFASRREAVDMGKLRSCAAGTALRPTDADDARRSRAEMSPACKRITAAISVICQE